MGAAGEVIVRLVEADMAVVADAEELQVGIAGGGDKLVVCGAVGLGVHIGAIGHERARLVDVHMVEEVVVHEVAVALRIVTGQTAILVEVIRTHLGEIEVARLVLGDKPFIGADRGGTRGKAEHAVRLKGDLGGDKIRRLTAHVLIIGCMDNLHDALLSI